MSLRRGIMMSAGNKKTLVTWNNLVNGYLSSADWKDRNTSDTLTTFSNGVASTEFLNSSGSYKTMTTIASVKTYAGHKYYGHFQGKFNKDLQNVSVGMDQANLVWTNVFSSQANEWNSFSGIVTGQKDRDSTTYVPRFTSVQANTGFIADTKNVVLVDLTLMFGTGNEPSAKDFEDICERNGMDLNTPQPQNVSGTELMWVI